MLSVPSKKLAPAVLAVAWILAAGFGMAKLLQYDLTPAEGASVAATWPSDSRLVRRPNVATVVMLAHPRCPCLRASLVELEVIAARRGPLLDIHVVFLSSDAFESDSSLSRMAKAISGVRVTFDPMGGEIAKFGAKASGHTLVYDTQGVLRFSGGITESRGHMGENFGRETVIELAQSGRASRTSTPVFGCALSNPAMYPSQRP